MSGPQLWRIEERTDPLRVYEVFRRAEKLEAIAVAFRALHEQTCDDYWADDECACGGRQLLAAIGVESS